MELIILIFAAFVTSSISAVLGMGGGIILLGIMAILIPEGYMVIALHGVIQLVSNTTRTYVFRNHLKKETEIKIQIFLENMEERIFVQNQILQEEENLMMDQ